MSTNLLERAELFAHLLPGERAILAERLELEHFAEGEVIFSEDAATRAIFLLKTGGVRLSMGPITLATLGAGAVFGEADVFLGRRRSITAVTTGPTEVWTLTKQNLDHVVLTHPAIGLKLSRSFGDRLVQLKPYLVDERLRVAPGFEGLDDGDLEELSDYFSLKTYRAGRTLYRAGENPESIFLIESGRVQVERAGEWVEAGPGEVLGLMALIADKVHIESARSVDETVAWTLSRADFHTLAANAPHIRSHLSQDLHARLSPSDEHLAVERLRALPIFSDLDSEILEAVARRLLLRHVPESEIIYQEGAVGDALYLVDSGRVEIVSSVVRRGEILARLGAGGFFGEMALLTGKSRTTGARAADDCNLWALYRSDFDDLVATYPALGQALSETLSERLRDAGGAFADRHLRKIGLFTGLTAEQLADVAERLFPARYRAGETVYKEGDSGDRLYMIETGTVRLGMASGPVARLGEGDFFGEHSLLTGEQHSVSAVAESNLEVWALTREEFEGLALKYPVLALNLSRALSRRPQMQTAVASPRRVAAAPVVRPQPAPVKRATPAAPVRTSTPIVTRKPGWFESLALWFGGLSRGAKLRLVLLALLLVWLLGIALPATVIDALQTSTALTAPPPSAPRVAVASASNSIAPVALALANREVEQSNPAPTETYTPVPTETPLPTDTPTPSPTPTDTPVPTATPTDTPVPTATPTDTPVPPTPTPRPVARAAAQAAAPAAEAELAAAAAPAPAAQYSLVEMRRLNPCENRGKHNIYVRVVDPAGNGINGVWVLQAAANNAAQVVDKRQTEDKDYWILERQAGRTDFAMFKGAEYMVFVSEDGANPANSEVAAPVHSNFTDEANCADGGGGNTLFHNSFSVVFQKNY